ncbi:MAG: hypothetical protein K0U54_12625 [Bacteroidetes bacterium]|nr:hypothetical protein [Bacteroidota bacterium]
MHRIYLNFFFFLFLSMALFSCKEDDSDNSAVDPTAENKKGLGTSAEDILSSDIYNRLVVQLAYSQNSRPTEEAIENFRAFIEARVHKSSGVSIVQTIVEDQPGSPFSIGDIIDIETNLRTEYTSGDKLAVFMYFTNGRSSNDTETSFTLGTAYRNTSMVIYESTLKLLTQQNTASLPVLESAVMNHEFGHILGLTNIVNDDIHQVHEDPSQAKHCIVDECLMYFDATNIGRTNVRRMLEKGAVPQLDPLCIADLQAKGGK